MSRRTANRGKKEPNDTEQALPLAGIITLVTAGVPGPFGGMLIDRRRVRRVIRVGAIMAAFEIIVVLAVFSLVDMFFVRPLSKGPDAFSQPQ